MIFRTWTDRTTTRSLWSVRLLIHNTSHGPGAGPPWDSCPGFVLYGAFYPEPRKKIGPLTSFLLPLIIFVHKYVFITHIHTHTHTQDEQAVSVLRRNLKIGIFLCILQTLHADEIITFSCRCVRRRRVGWRVCVCVCGGGDFWFAFRDKHLSVDPDGYNMTFTPMKQELSAENNSHILQDYQSKVWLC